MKRLSTLFKISLVTFMAMACVTVNIYFPAAKVEKTADEIVEDVYRQEGDVQGDESSLGFFLAALIGPGEAYAQQATTVSNSAIRGLKEQISQRHKQLLPFYQGKNIGINNNGYLEVLNTDGLPLQQVAGVKRLVQADNADRKKLYGEVAKALDIDQSQIEKIEEIFAQTWRDKADSGWMVQNDNGKWAVK